MNLGELRTLFLSWMDDTDGGYFTSGQTDVFINNAVLQTQRTLIQAFEDYFTDCVETTSVINQEEYILPDDFLKIAHLQWVESGTDVSDEQLKTISRMAKSEQDLLIEKTGRPKYYFFRGDKFVLRPAPDVAKTIRLYYVKKVAELVNDSDVPDIPSQYHEMIALYAARDGYIKDGRDPSQLIAKLLDYETSIKRDAENRNVDGPRDIVITGHDDAGFAY